MPHFDRTVDSSGRKRRIFWYDVEAWCGHVFGFLCGKTLPPASMDYASSVHFRLTCR